MGSISVSNLGKAYKQYSTRWSRLVEWFDPRGVPRHQNHWVLNDVSFSISAGEAVGILGVNGAGKSTLLKMITGTTQPTTGSVHRTGSLAALLELGMGFHPDFTGRQNVLMAGQLLGMHAEEIATLMPEIESFAAIGDYIDQPVRVYSSGMQVRLAFAVATCKRPDILIVDEALSVGDAAFQRKCYQRIEGFRSQGTTLLFVTHDVETVKKICDSALFLKDGRLQSWGKAKTVCDEYERFLFGGNKPALESLVVHNVETPKASHFDPALSVHECEVVYGSGKAEIQSCWLTNERGQKINVIESGTRFNWQYQVRFKEDVINPIFAMMLKTREGFALYGIDSKHHDMGAKKFSKGQTVVVSFGLANPLAPGVYYLNCGVRLDNDEDADFLCRRIDSAILKITAGANSTVVAGLLEMHAKIELSDLLLNEA